jgi:multicomponent Na+:H+ antiporter subunit F
MTMEFVCALLIVIGILAVLYRVILGPTLLDRLLAVNVIGTKTIVLLCLIGFVYGRPDMFLDIALAYALINFIATIAVLRYLEGLGRGTARRRGGLEGEGSDS